MTYTATQIRNNGLASLSALFAQLGLPKSLIDWARVMLVEGNTETQIEQQLYLRPEFKARFPGIDRRRALGLAPISPAEYVGYENGVRQAFTQAGIKLPRTGAKFNQMITGLLESDVSMAELIQDRIGTSFKRVQNAPVEVRDAWRRLWGAEGDNALATFFLDPTMAGDALEEISQAAYAAGTGTRAGYGLDRDQAMRFAAADVAPKQIEDAAILRPLFDQQIGDTSELDAATGLAGIVGLDGEATRAVQRRMETRQAQFAGGGDVTEGRGESNQGLIGLGSGRE